VANGNNLRPIAVAILSINPSAFFNELAYPSIVLLASPWMYVVISINLLYLNCIFVAVSKFCHFSFIPCDKAYSAIVVSFKISPYLFNASVSPVNAPFIAVNASSSVTLKKEEKSAVNVAKSLDIFLKNEVSNPAPLNIEP